MINKRHTKPTVYTPHWYANSNFLGLLVLLYTSWGALEK